MVTRFLKTGIFFCALSLPVTIHAESKNEFIKSFIDFYDVTDRYTHEYHPFIRRKTGDSLLLLEQGLKEAGITVDGRMIIFGFQENAFPVYSTDYDKACIDDESDVDTSEGKSLPAKNLFGFYTGYLLKDIDFIHERLGKNSSFAFYAVEEPELFRQGKEIYREDAFGTAYESIKKVRKEIEQAALQNKYRLVFKNVLDFWKHLYNKETKNGSQQTVATQDILFSIQYLESLNTGKAELKKFFVGPDITYPIEVLQSQKTEATRHAQKFVQAFAHELKPLNGQKTAYIFCSFVDGVGKTTLFNNVKNYLRYGTDVARYGRCDNSSSQEFELLEILPDTYIIDLPAQVSHFAIKPDGFVYADPKTIKTLNQVLFDEACFYIKQNNAYLINCFSLLKKRAVEQKEPLYAHPEDRGYTYAQNVVALGSRSAWVPVTYRDMHLLYNPENLEQVLVLTPLAGAHSTALKTVEPERMLFSNGVILPMAFTGFLQRLISSLRQNGIERISFVDFLSMYPRTSRENVRINFMLQYLKKLHGSAYDTEKSFYKHRVNGEPELYYLMHHEKQAIKKTLALETSFRTGFYSLMEKTSGDCLTSINGKELHAVIIDESNRIENAHKDVVEELVAKKIKQEHDLRAQSGSCNKIYESLLTFDYNAALLFSTMLVQYFTQPGAEEYTKILWQGLTGNLISLEPLRQEHGMPVYSLDNGTEVFIADSIDESIREQALVTPFLQRIRAHWYYLISFLLGNARLDNSIYPAHALGMCLKRGPDSKIYSVQKYIPFQAVSSYGKVEAVNPPVRFNVVKGRSPGLFGIFGGMQFCLNWATPYTYLLLYNYSYFLDTTGKIESNLITKLVQTMPEIKQYGSQAFVSTSSLYSLIDKVGCWHEVGKASAPQTSSVYNADNIRLWIRMIATLDMIIKDPQAAIMSRKGNKSDFWAALKLLEKITLPLYFNIRTKTPFFSNYEQVEPVLPWTLFL